MSKRVKLRDANLLKNGKTSLPERYKLADSEAMINGCVFKINDETNRTEEIIRINNR